MNATEILLCFLYIVGIFMWMIVEKIFFPYEEGEYTLEWWGAEEITEDIHNGRAVCRSVLWPLCLAFIIMMLPVVLLNKIFEKL